MRSYEEVIAFAAESYFLGHDKPDDSDFTTLIAFTYQKDELRVIHDINEYLRKRDQKK